MGLYVVDTYKKRIYECGLKVAKKVVDDDNDGKVYLKGNLDAAKQAMLDELEKIKKEPVYQQLPTYSQISIINSISCSDLQIYWRTKLKHSQRFIIITFIMVIFIAFVLFIFGVFNNIT
ncbi:MAG: hypothetical protein Q8M70_03095 [bacterium]|nr:hypothetical protein [bacterium]